MVRTEMSAIHDLFTKVFYAVLASDFSALEQLMTELQPLSVNYMIKLSMWGLACLPFVALLTVILLAFANTAVKNCRGKRSFGRMSWIATAHVLIALVKGLAFLFFVIPGVYLYVRLLFVSLVMLEDETAGVGEAIRKSWVMTCGNFWKLLGLVCLNSFLQLITAPTIIGLVPFTGFVNTARAAAFQMLRDEAEED